MARMTGNEYFARAMQGYGVTHLFFVPSILNGAMQTCSDIAQQAIAAAATAARLRSSRDARRTRCSS